MRSYAIYDTLLETYWVTPNQNRIWKSTAAAKNAWNYYNTAWRADNPLFSEQTRFECHEVELKLIRRTS